MVAPLAGFMVGDTSGVDEVDQAAMKRAGLSHFTAVSGSNVALFLGLLYVVAGPLGIGPSGGRSWACWVYRCSQPRRDASLPSFVPLPWPVWSWVVVSSEW